MCSTSRPSTATRQESDSNGYSPDPQGPKGAQEGAEEGSPPLLPGAGFQRVHAFHRAAAKETSRTSSASVPATLVARPMGTPGQLQGPTGGQLWPARIPRVPGGCPGTGGLAPCLSTCLLSCCVKARPPQKACSALVRDREVGAWSEPQATSAPGINAGQVVDTYGGRVRP